MAVLVGTCRKDKRATVVGDWTHLQLADFHVGCHGEYMEKVSHADWT
jgi:hypothetical protein